MLDREAQIVCSLRGRLCGVAGGPAPFDLGEEDVVIGGVDHDFGRRGFVEDRRLVGGQRALGLLLRQVELTGLQEGTRERGLDVDVGGVEFEGLLQDLLSLDGRGARARAPEGHRLLE